MFRRQKLSEAQVYDTLKTVRPAVEASVPPGQPSEGTAGKPGAGRRNGEPPGAPTLTGQRAGTRATTGLGAAIPPGGA
jgi:hypothetical protein